MGDWLKPVLFPGNLGRNWVVSVFLVLEAIRNKALKSIITAFSTRKTREVKEARMLGGKRKNKQKPRKEERQKAAFESRSKCFWKPTVLSAWVMRALCVLETSFPFPSLVAPHQPKGLRLPAAKKPIYLWWTQHLTTVPFFTILSWLIELSLLSSSLRISISFHEILWEMLSETAMSPKQNAAKKWNVSMKFYFMDVNREQHSLDCRFS